MIWTVLGIEETKDKKAITNAYRERLSVINPEEKPDEFKELRAAYEEALRLADEKEKLQEEKTELELWTDELKALYFDLPRRQDVNEWKELLSRDICEALDSRSQVEEAMLRFFMDHYRIPHKIMLYLDEQFNFSGRMDELKEKFPADFLQYVIEARIRDEDTFPISLFSPGLDGNASDIYEDVYRKALHTDPEDAEGMYEQLRNSSEKHPYGEALLIEVRLSRGDASALEELEKLHESYPEDDHLALDLAQIYKKTERMELFEKLVDECLEKYPEHSLAKRYKAEALAARGEYKEAIDIISRLMQKNIGDQRSSVELDDLRREWNDALALQLQDKLAADPDDADSRFDLVWCYLQNGKTEQADEIAADLPKETPDAFGYYNVKAFIASESGRLEEALAYSQKLLEAVDQLRPDGTEKTLERIGRRTEVVGRISNILFELGREEEALEMADQSVLDGEADLGSLFNLMNMHMRAKHYGRVSELADLIIQSNPDNSGAFFYKALASYRMNNDSIAFETINSAIDRDASNLQFYLLKLLILVRNNAFDAAQDLIDLLAQNDITDEPTINYCKLVMFAKLKDDDTKQDEYDRVLAMAEGIDRTLAAGEYGCPDWTGDFYYQYASISADRQNFSKDYPTEPLIAILDKGIDMKPEHYACRSYKAWLLKKSDRTEEALKLYKELEQIPDHNMNVELNLAEIYYSQMANHAEDALHYYNLLIENDPEDADLYFYAGMCNFRLERPEEAERCFRLEQKYGPDDIDGYYRLAYALLKMNRLDEAVEQGLKTVELAKKRDGDTVRFWNPLINAYRRLGETGAAIDAIMDCAEKNPTWKYREKIFDIYLQMGMYDKAETLVNTWRNAPKLKKEMKWQNSLVTLYMLRNETDKLARFLFHNRSSIDDHDAELANRIYYAAKGDFKYYLLYAGIAHKKAIDENRSDSYERGNYAWALFAGGKPDEARAEAAAALEGTEKLMQQATGMKLMYAGRKIYLLSILGREDEARQACAEAETLRPCENCEYFGCKDLAIYKGQMEFIFGNYDKAMEIAVDGSNKWPDDTDFIELMYLIKAKSKKKGKKKC